MGRKVLLYDADEKTYDWYTANRGLDMRPFKVDVSDPVVEPPEVTPPPWNGYGTEEDSLNSFFSLIPKRPRKDWAKIWAHDGQVCRRAVIASARLCSPRSDRLVMLDVQLCPRERSTSHIGAHVALFCTCFLRSPPAGLAVPCSPRGAPDGA
jgi:hypothetical protein